MSSNKSRKSSASASTSKSSNKAFAETEESTNNVDEVIDLFQSSSSSNNGTTSSSFSSSMNPIPRSNRNSTISMNSQQYEQISVKEILSRLRTSNASTTASTRSTAINNSGMTTANSKSTFNITNKDLIAAGMTIDDLIEPEHAEYCIEAPKSGLLMKEEVITPLFLPTRCELEQEENSSLPTTATVVSNANDKYGPEVRNVIYCADQELFAEHQQAVSSSSSSSNKPHWGLQFDSNFECGNLFAVESLMRKRAPIGSPEEYDLYLWCDPTAPLPPSKHVYSPTSTTLQNQWFFFRIKNTKKKQYRFHIHHLTNKLSGFIQGMKPMMISEQSFTDESQGWKRVGQDIQYHPCQRRSLLDYSHSAYHPFLPPYQKDEVEGGKSAPGKHKDSHEVELFTLSFTFNCTTAKDTIYFALTTPYSYTQLQNMVYVISKNPLTRCHLQFKTLCRTLGGNKVDLLVITENNCLIKDTSQSMTEQAGEKKTNEAGVIVEEEDEDDAEIDDYKLKDVLPQSVILQSLGLNSMPGDANHLTPTPPSSSSGNSSARNSKFINRPSVVRHPPPNGSSDEGKTADEANPTATAGGKTVLPRFLQKLQHQMDEDKEHVRRLKLERRRKPAIIITARMHPNETCSSWICEGIVKTLLGNNAIAQELRKYFVFYVIPMVNPDGVINGLTRYDITGFDLKDHWVDPSSTLHPQIYTIKQLLRNIHQTTSIAGYFELRGQFYKEGMYFHSLLPTESSNIALRPSSQIDPRQFFYASAKRSKYVMLRNCSLTMTTDQEHGAKYFAWDELHVALSMTIEASMVFAPKGCPHAYSFLPPAQVARINPHLQPIDYGKFGLQICLTLADLFIFPNNSNFTANANGLMSGNNSISRRMSSFGGGNAGSIVSGKFNNIVDILEHLPDIDSDKPFEANTAPRENRVHVTSPSRRRSSMSPKHTSFLGGSVAQQSISSSLRHFSQTSFSLNQYRKMSLCIGSSDHEEQINQSFLAIQPVAAIDQQYSFSAIPPDEDRLRLQQLLTASADKGDKPGGAIETVEIDVIDDVERQVNFNEAIWEQNKNPVSEYAMHTGWGTARSHGTNVTNTSNAMSSLDNVLTYHVYKNIAKLLRRKEVLQVEKLIMSAENSRASTAGAHSGTNAAILRPSEMIGTDDHRGDDSEEDELETWTGIQPTATNTERVYRQIVSSSGFKPIQLLTLLPSKVGQKIQELERRTSNAGIAEAPIIVPTPVNTVNKPSLSVITATSLRPTKLAGIHEEEDEHRDHAHTPTMGTSSVISAPAPVAPAPAPSPMKSIPNKLNIKGVITVSFSAEAIEQRKQQLASTRSTMISESGETVSYGLPTTEDTHAEQRKLEETLIQRMVSIDFNEDADEDNKKRKKKGKTNKEQGTDKEEKGGNDTVATVDDQQVAENSEKEREKSSPIKSRKSTVVSSPSVGHRGTSKIILSSRRSVELSGTAMAEILEKVVDGTKEEGKRKLHEEEVVSDQDGSGTEGKNKSVRKRGATINSRKSFSSNDAAEDSTPAKDVHNKGSPRAGSKNTKTSPSHNSRSTNISAHGKEGKQSKSQHAKTNLKNNPHSSSAVSMVTDLSNATEDFEDSIADSEPSNYTASGNKKILIPGIKIDTTTSISRPSSPTLEMINRNESRDDRDVDEDEDESLMTSSVAATILMEEEDLTTPDDIRSAPMSAEEHKREQSKEQAINVVEKVAMSTQTDQDYFHQLEEENKKQRLHELLQTMFSISPALANALQPAIESIGNNAEEESEKKESVLSTDAVHILLKELGVTFPTASADSSASNATTGTIKKTMPNSILPTSMNISAANILPTDIAEEKSEGIANSTPLPANPLLQNKQRMRLLSHPTITDVSTLHVKKHATLVEDDEDEQMDEMETFQSPQSIPMFAEDDPVTSRQLAQTLLDLAENQQRVEEAQIVTEVKKMDFSGGKAVVLSEASVASNPTKVSFSVDASISNYEEQKKQQKGIEPPNLSISHKELLTQLRNKYATELEVEDDFTRDQAVDAEELEIHLSEELQQQTSRTATPRIPPDNMGFASAPSTANNNRVRTAASTAFTDDLTTNPDSHMAVDGQIETKSFDGCNDVEEEEKTVVVSNSSHTQNKYYHLTQHARLIFPSPSHSPSLTQPSSALHKQLGNSMKFSSTEPTPATAATTSGKVSGSSYGQWDYKGKSQAEYLKRRKAKEALEYEIYEKPNSTENLQELQGKFLQDMGLDYELIFGKNGILARSHWQDSTAHPTTSLHSADDINQVKQQHEVNLNGTYSQRFPQRTAVYDHAIGYDHQGRAVGIIAKKRGQAGHITDRPEFAVNVNILNDYQKAVFGFYNHVLSQLEKHGLCEDLETEEVAQQIVDLLQQQLDPHMGIISPRVGAVHSPRGRLTAFPNNANKTNPPKTIPKKEVTTKRPDKSDGDEMVRQVEATENPPLSARERMDMRFAQIMKKEQQAVTSKQTGINLPNWLPTPLQKLLQGSSKATDVSEEAKTANSTLKAWLAPSTTTSTKRAQQEKEEIVVSISAEGSMILNEKSGVPHEDSLMNPSVPSLQYYTGISASSVSQDSLLLPPNVLIDGNGVIHPPPMSANQRRNMTKLQSADVDQKKPKAVTQLQIFPDRLPPTYSNNGTSSSNIGKKLLDKKNQQRLEQAKATRQQALINGRKSPVNQFLYEAGGTDLFLISTAAPTSVRHSVTTQPSTAPSIATAETKQASEEVEVKPSSNQEDTTSDAAVPLPPSNPSSPTTSSKHAKFKGLQRLDSEDSTYIKYSNLYQQGILQGAFDGDHTPGVNLSRAMTPSINSRANTPSTSTDPTRPAQPKPSHHLTRPR